MMQRYSQLSGPGAAPQVVAALPRRFGPRRAWQVVAVAVGVCAAAQASAQDVIIKNDKTEINSKVIEITEDHVKYRLFDFLDGPLYNVRKTDVWMIIYEKGRREKFNAPEQVAAAAPAAPAPAPAVPATPVPATTAAAPATPAPQAPAPVSQLAVVQPAPVSAPGADQAAATSVPPTQPAQPANTPQPAAVAQSASGPSDSAAPVMDAPEASPQAVVPQPAPAAPASGNDEKPAAPATEAAPAAPAAPATPSGAEPQASNTASADAALPVTASTAAPEPAVAAEPVPATAAVEAAPTPAPTAPVTVAALQREPAVEAAQGQEVWTKLGNGPAPVKYINVDGNILILKPNFVMSLAKNTGKQQWLTKVERTKSAHLLGNGPLIHVVATSLQSDYLQSIILDSRTGRTVYSPPAGVAQVENRVIDAQNIVVWEATDGGTRALVLEHGTGTRLADIKISAARGKTAKVVSLPNGKVAMLSSYGLSALDPGAAKLVYNVPLKRSAKVAELLPPTEPTLEVFETGTPGHMCVLMDGYLTSVNLLTGKITGEKELPGAFVTFRELDKNQLIVGKSGKKDKDLLLALYDKSTCQELRSATVNINNAGAMLAHNNNLFVVGGGSSVKLIDLSNLALKAEKTFKTNGDNVQLFATNNGVGLLSASFVEYFDPKGYAATGKTKYFDPAGRAKLKASDDTYFWANGYLGRVNLQKGEETLLLKDKLPIKLLEGEVPQLELLDDGVAVITTQSVVKVNFQGGIVYNLYFAPPKVVAGAIASHSTAQAATPAQVKAAPLSGPKQSWIANQRTFELGGSAAVTPGTVRANGLLAGLKHHIVLTKADRDEVGRFKLLKINKATGKVEGQVEVENRTPDYIFDPIDSVVYLFDVDSVKAYKI
ncbi:PQQ-binding-like beta-propeller repeat protein [Hymenobacter koreensis]|uniref:Pyrrolo-quinoline quinone repeat domain-containing protein n=1 Tax=Hymenobacter koreensis TaxID=1084523 RepID=A0ABP8IYM3_9BACT